MEIRSTAVDAPAAPYSDAFVRDPYPTYAWFRAAGAMVTVEHVSH